MNKIWIETETKTGNERATFECPGCKMIHSIYVKGSGVPVWNWNESLDNPTFKPSILVRWNLPSGDKICHSFVTKGKIQFLNDCTHELAGQTVDLYLVK